jgi:AAA15 family ATPase/GTPase
MHKALSTDNSETEEERQERLLQLIPESIVIQSQKPSFMNYTDGNTNTGFISEKTVETIKSGIYFNIISAGGTKSPKTKPTPVKQKLNVMVSNLRRYFYHQPNIDDDYAEEIIDAKLEEMDAYNKYGYIKSQRRMPPGGYAPLA